MVTRCQSKPKIIYNNGIIIISIISCLKNHKGYHKYERLGITYGNAIQLNMSFKIMNLKDDSFGDITRWKKSKNETS